MEIWKDIKGYEGYYQVSDLGRIKSLNRTIVYIDNDIHYYKEKLLKQYKNKKHGYLNVKICKNNKQLTRNTHRLVAEAFIENDECKPLVNHKNGVKTDNRVSNLEWCTQAENMKHAREVLNFNPKFQPSSKKVECSNGMIFNSTYEAARWINDNIFFNTRKDKTISIDIRNVCNGKIKKRKTKYGINSLIRKKAYGYGWKHVS